jgi:hypothetical protein
MNVLTWIQLSAIVFLNFLVIMNMRWAVKLNGTNQELLEEKRKDRTEWSQRKSEWLELMTEANRKTTEMKDLLREIHREKNE